MVGVHRVLVNLLVVGTLLASGCAEMGTEAALDAEPDHHDDGNHTVGTNVTVEQLTPNVVITVDGNVTELVNGTYALPADTNITFDATNSTGNITLFEWTIGNQTLNGTMIQFAFPAGNHTVNLTAIGAANQTAALSLPINATSMGPAELVLVGTTDLAFSGAAKTVYNGGCMTGSKAVTFPEGTTTQYVKLTMDPTWAGVALSISYQVYLQDAEGNQVPKATRSGGNAVVTAEGFDLGLPAGDYTAVGKICGTAVPQGEFSMTGIAEHYA